MSEKTEFEAIYLGQTEKARHLAPVGLEEGIWIPKSVFTYYSNDGAGNVKFRVEGWKVRDVRAAGFTET